MIGETVSHYKIVEKLGQGGMGVVYKAEDSKLNRIVALKFLPPQTLAAEDDKTRFVREAQAAAALQHPNVCTVYEIDEADGRTFIAMAYLSGRTLDGRIKEGPLPLDSALDIAAQVADGLREAHGHNIVHRDIKSANVMVGQQGRATIMDFGLAKATDQTAVTQEGMTAGTIAYMSPEQARGDELDQRTDIFSLGVLLFEMIAGRRPFRGEHNSAVIYSILNEDPEPLTALRTDVPVVVEHIVGKMLAKSADESYQNTDDLLVDLRRAQKELGGEAPDRAMKAPPQGVSLSRHLFERRVPQLLTLYTAIALGVWWFAGWLVDRYPISPNVPVRST